MANNTRKYELNEDYFLTESHSMAYILGIWYLVFKQDEDIVYSYRKSISWDNSRIRISDSY